MLSSKRGHLNLKHPYRAIVDNLTYTLEAVWAWYRVPTKNWDILTEHERDEMERSLLAAFESYRDVDCHLLTTYRPFDVDAWAEATMRDGWWPSKAAAADWEQHVRMQAEHMRPQHFQTKEVYFGIFLGSRAKNEVMARYDRFKDRSGVANPAISDDEHDRWLLKAANYTASLGRGGLQARPATFSELVWLCQRNLHHRLALPIDYGTVEVSGEDLNELFQVPYHHGPGDRSLVYEHTDGVAHVAYLSLTGFPEDLTGMEWLNLDGFDDVEVSWRYRLLTPPQARKKIEKQLRAAHDNRAGAYEAGTDVPLDEQGKVQQALLLERDLMADGGSVLSGRPILRVSAGSHQRLATTLHDLATYYREAYGIRVVNRVSPMPFALDGLPGGRQEVVFHQTNRVQSTSVLVGAMPLAAVKVGDETGPYLGFSHGRTPIFWDPLRLASRGGGTVVAVVGESGQGKTNFTLKNALESPKRGATAIYCTIKSETDKVSQFPGMSCHRCRDCRNGVECRRGRLNRVIVGPNSPYRWDPLQQDGDPDEKWPLAVELAGQFIANPLSNLQRSALEEAAQKQADSASGSMTGLVADLRAHKHDEVKQIGQLLYSVSRTPLGRLCFGTIADRLLVPEGKLTIIEATGLDLPDPSAVDLTPTQRISVGIVSMITYWCIRQAIRNRHQPKYIGFDEVAFLLSSTVGLKVINLLGLVHGRASNTTLVLSTQNASALMGQAFSVNMVARVGFRTPVEGPNPATMAMFAMDDNMGTRQYWSSLGVGQAVFSFQGNRAGISIDLGPPEMSEPLDTQPHPEQHIPSGNGSRTRPAPARKP